MTLKNTKDGKLTIPAPKPKPEKVWITFQIDTKTRNELTKRAEKFNLNLSRYFRKKALDLLEATKYGKLPADADTLCSKCRGKLD